MKAVFSVEGRTGFQRKSISVTTDEPGHPTARLTLETDIPAFVTVEPRMLVWPIGGESVWKEMNISTDASYNVVVGPKTNDVALPPYELNPGKRPGQYIHSVHPQNPAIRGHTRFPLSIEMPNGVTKPYAVYLLV